VYVGQHLSFVRAGKATDGEPRSEPDWGNPTVRDRRGACGNADYGGTRTPPRVSKERVLETLRLTLCAPQIYPDLRGICDRKQLQTWYPSSRMLRVVVGVQTETSDRRPTALQGRREQDLTESSSPSDAHEGSGRR